MKVFAFLFKSSWKYMLYGVLGSLLAAGLYTLGIKMLNQYIHNQGEDALTDLASLGALFVISGLVSVHISKVLTYHFESCMTRLRGDFSLKILRSNFERAEVNREKFVPVLVADLVNLGWFAKTIPDALVAIFQILGVLGYLFSISWEMTLSFILMSLVSFLFVFMIFPVIYRTEKEYGRIRNKLFATVEGLGMGLKDLSLNQKHKEWFVDHVILPSSRANGMIVTKLNSLDIGIAKFIETLILACLGVTIWILRSLTDFENEQFLTFLTIMLFVLPGFIRLSTFFKRLKKAEVALEQLDMLNIKFDDMEEHNAAVQLQLQMTDSQNPVISLKGVKYTYTESDIKFSVGPIDLDLYPNEILLIRGGNGSGKTTLAKILTGLYLPQEGSAFFQGQMITDQNLLSFRDQFGAVFTDSYVFGDLSYLQTSADPDKAISLLEELEIENKVNLSEWSLSSTHLSFGQMGRLSLFRVLLEDKPIMLLDEWAANQDPHFKEKFYLEIIPGLKKEGKTLVIISHDDQYYHIADRIVKISAGSVSEIIKPNQEK